MAKAPKATVSDISFQEENIVYVVVASAFLGSKSVELRYYPNINTEVLVVEKDGVIERQVFGPDDDAGPEIFGTEVSAGIYDPNGFYKKVRDAANKLPAKPVTPGSGDFS